jgi:hypothetical protein
MRAKRAVAAVAALLLVGVPHAAAHEGNPSYRSEVTRVTPSSDGLDIEVLNFDDSLRLTNRTGEDLVIEGYDGEPYARIAANGTVELNRNSPAYYLNDDRFAESEVPLEAEASSAPDWERVDGSGTLTWHDHRMHWMSRTVPPQVEDKSTETKVFDYEIPIELGSRRGAIEGTLTWVGEDSGFPIAPFIGLAIVAALGTGAVAVRRSRGGKGEPDESGGW